MRHLLLLTLCGLGCATASPSSSSSSPSSSGAASSAAAQAQLAELTHAAAAYATVYGRCPMSTAELQRAPNGEVFISGRATDPWGHEIAFMPPSEETPSAAFVSAGPDGALLTTDDITAPVACSTR